MPHHADHPSRLIAKLMREALHDHHDSLSSFLDVVKFRLARLHIAWTNDDLTDALRVIESNTPLPMVQGLITKHTPARVERHDDEPPLSRDDAARILHTLRTRFLQQEHRDVA